MQYIYQTVTTLILSSLLLFGGAPGLAQSAPPVPDELYDGKTLTAQQIEALGALPSYTSAQSRYRVLPAPATIQKAHSGSTRILTEQGVVVTSYHQVMLSDVAENQVRQAAARGPRPVRITYLAPTGITLLEYADFSQTMAGLNALQAQLPRTLVRLPLSSGKLVAH